MEQKIIIGLIGDNRVGKDTIAAYINQYINSHSSYVNIDIDNAENTLETTQCKCKNLAFADNVKDVGRILFNFSDEQLYGSKKEIIDERWGITPREFMTIFGTEIMQYDIYKYFPNLANFVEPKTFWAKRTLSFIENNENNYKYYIITDIRFNHELKALNDINNKCQKYKLVLIKVTREGQYTNADITHKSRTELTELLELDLSTKFNNIQQTNIYSINNDKTLHDLKNKVNLIMDDIVI